MKISPQISALFDGLEFSAKNSHVFAENFVVRPHSIFVEFEKEEYINIGLEITAHMLATGVLNNDLFVQQMGVAALCKAIGRGRFEAPDCSVRALSLEQALHIAEVDSGDIILVAITGHGAVREIVGWIKANDARKDQWLHWSGGWAVPADALRPIRELYAASHKIHDLQIHSIISPKKSRAPIDMELEMLRRPTTVEELWRMAKAAHGAI